MKKLKSVLALILSVALLASFLPIIPTIAETASFVYADKLDAQAGETIFSYDFSKDAAPDTATSGNGNTWITTSSALGKKALYFQYGNWSDEGRKAEFNVGTANFAARITVAVDNGISNNQSGRFRVYTRNSSGYTSYIDIGLPDRTGTDPSAGGVAIYNENGVTDKHTGVTPFTKDSTVATFTFEIYSFDGVVYYTTEDGTLIGRQNYRTGYVLDDTTFLRLTCGYGEAWVTDITAVELAEKQAEEPPVEENPFAYATTLNTQTGETIVNFDFLKETPDQVPDEYTNGPKGNVWRAKLFDISDTALRGMYFDNGGSSWNRYATFDIGKADFAARITVAVDNGISTSQSGRIRVETNSSGGTASYIDIGLPDRSSNDPKAGAVAIYNQAAQYGFDVYGNVTPFTANSAQEFFTFEVYNLNGVAYYTTADGTLIGSAANKSGVALDATTSLKIRCEYGKIYVTDIAVVELSEIQAEEPPVVEDTSFAYLETLDASAVSDVVAYDFLKETPDTLPDSYTNGPDGNVWRDRLFKNQNTEDRGIYFQYGTNWNRKITFAVGKANFAARITVAVDNGISNKQSGRFRVQSISSAGTASYIEIGLPDRSSGDPKAGNVAIYNESAQYGFDNYYDVTPFTSDSTQEFFTFEVYNLNGVAYYTTADGTLIGSSAHKSSVTLDTTSSIKLDCDYGEVWVTDITVKEIVANVVEPPVVEDDTKFVYAETLNAQTAETVVSYDFLKETPDTLPDSYTNGPNGNVWRARLFNNSDSEQRGIYFQYGTNWNRKITFAVGKANFAARITVAVDNGISSNQSGKFRVQSISSAGTASYIEIGLPDRSSSDPKAGNVAIYNESAQFGFDNYYNVTPFTSDSTQEFFTFEVYNYNGIAYYTTEDGTLIGSAAHKSSVTLDATSSIKLDCDYGEVWVTDIVVCELEDKIAEVETVFGEKVFKVSDFVEDNETYKINFKYSADTAVKLGFFVADIEVENTIGYIEGKNVAIFTANGEGNAEILLTVDKKGGLNNAVGEELYMYVIGGDVADIKVSALSYKKITNASGGAVVANKGVSILEGVAEDKEQAMRYYFSYDTTTGNNIIIDGVAYDLKSRGFLVANGDVMGEETVTRELAKNGNIFDMNVSKNLNNCWNVQRNTDALGSSLLWFSTYVKGFDAIDGTYNNKDRLYVKGYVVVEVNGVEYTLYGKEINYTVKDVSNLIGVSSGTTQTENVTGDNRVLVWNNEFNTNGSLGDMWAHYNNPPTDTETFSKSADNVFVNNGSLTLSVSPNGDGKYTLPYDVVSRDSMAFKYGYVEIRAKVPFRKGFLPAFWLTPDQNLRESQYNGEIDIFEVFGSEDTTSSTLHVWGNDWAHLWQTEGAGMEHSWSWTETTFGGVKPEDWHTYGLEWTENEMKFYLDGECYATVNLSNLGYDTKNCFNDFYTIILDNSVYEDTVKQNGTEQVDMLVDYVRLYQLRESEYMVDYS